MKETSILTLLTARIAVVGLVFIAASAFTSNLSPYELRIWTDSTTEQTGSIILICRDSYTAEELEISEIGFFLNRSSVSDLSLREMEDITVVEIGSTRIKFNLTRRLDGYYTCGKRVNATHVIESWPKIFISLQTLISLPDPPPQTNLTAMFGERVVLSCPIQPGALLQQYSVRWYKGGSLIAQATNPQSIRTVDDSRYNIDRDNYSLIIDSANINDTNSNYQCELSVTNPNTNTLEKLQSSLPVALSLKVYADDEEPTDPGDSTTENPADPASVRVTDELTDDPLVNLWCTCQQHKKPPVL